jgi:hypothetical protein
VANGRREWQPKTDLKEREKMERTEEKKRRALVSKPTEICRELRCIMSRPSWRLRSVGWAMSPMNLRDLSLSVM